MKSVPTARVRVARDLSWTDRFDVPRKPLLLRIGETIEVGDLESFNGFGRGWGFPDPTAIWTRGPRAELALRCRDAEQGRYLFEVCFGRVGVRPGDSLDVALVIDGAPVATRSFPGGTYPVTWRAGIPAGALARPVLDVVLEIDARGGWTDDRQIGLHVQSVSVRRDGLRRLFRDVAARARPVLARLARNRRLRPAST